MFDICIFLCFSTSVKDIFWKKSREIRVRRVFWMDSCEWKRFWDLINISGVNLLPPLPGSSWSLSFGVCLIHQIVMWLFSFIQQVVAERNYGKTTICHRHHIQLWASNFQHSSQHSTKKICQWLNSIKIPELRDPHRLFNSNVAALWLVLMNTSQTELRPLAVDVYGCGPRSFLKAPDVSSACAGL